MNITVIEQPAYEPVSLAEVYAHLRLDAEGSPLSHPDDAMLTRHIETARKMVEAMARRSLVQQKIRLSTAAFPTGDHSSRILLRRPPVLSVSAVRYYDISNVLQTLPETDYYFTDEQIPELRLATSVSTPTVYDRPDAVRVEYYAGYEPEGASPASREQYIANVPKPLRDAILLTVQLLYDSMSDKDAERIQLMRESLVQPLRIQLI